MDEGSIVQASTEQLEELGLKEMGHIISIKAFVMKASLEESTERKKVLIHSIKTTSQERLTGQKTNSRTERKVQIGWKLYNGVTWSQVRAASGGGVRELLVQTDEILDGVKKRAIELFFPNGSSKKSGSSSNYVMKLGDFSAEAIEDLTKSIGEYLREVKMSGRIRLYLLTEKKSVSTILKELGSDSLSDSDDDFVTTPLRKKTKKVETKVEGEELL